MTTKNKDEIKLDYQDAFQAMVKHPIAKLLLIGGAVVGLIFISGLVMKVVSNSVISYKNLREAIKK